MPPNLDGMRREGLLEAVERAVRREKMPAAGWRGWRLEGGTLGVAAPAVGGSVQRWWWMRAPSWIGSLQTAWMGC